MTVHAFLPLIIMAQIMPSSIVLGYRLSVRLTFMYVGTLLKQLAVKIFTRLQPVECGLVILHKICGAVIITEHM